MRSSAVVRRPGAPPRCRRGGRCGSPSHHPARRSCTPTRAADARGVTALVLPVAGGRCQARGVLSPQSLTEDDRCLVARWAADGAERVLAVFEAEAPDDLRPRDGIARARSFARGELDAASQIRLRFVAGRAAGSATSPAGAAAARAAGAGIGRRADGCARARRSSVRSTGSGAPRTRSRRGRRTGVAVGERERSGPGCAPTPPTARDGPVRTARSGAPRDGRPRSAHRPHPGRARPVALARWASPVERQLVRALRSVSLGYSPYRAA